MFFAIIIHNLILRTAPWMCSCLLLPTMALQATPAQTYLTKFTTYLHWSQHLPSEPTENFLAFIKTPSPLTNKLREKWLYQLAHQKNWAAFYQYYRPSSDKTLQCYAQTAAYEEGDPEEAWKHARALWLTGHSLPNACNALFNTMLNRHAISNDLIQKRISLALKANHPSLARYLLKQYQPARIEDAEQLTLITQHPTRIGLLKPGPFRGDFYLYGLSRLLQNNVKQTKTLWAMAHAQHFMTEAQEQNFLAQMAQLQAMNNQPDALTWFAQVKPAFYHETLLEWEMRFALQHEQWRTLIYLISHSKKKHEPYHQYWMARALEALGETKTAQALYAQLASKRDYYGFLASLKLHQKPNFEAEPLLTQTKNALLTYQPILDQIKTLYTSHLRLDAIKLLHDFVSELPKPEKAAVAQWVGQTLQWHAKAIHLSSDEALKNQLHIRFPLIYQTTIQNYAQHYDVPAALVYAIIRQESAFQTDIASPVGAQGLMQLMPTTAKSIAKQTNIPYVDAKQLAQSDTNIRIGTAYLQQLSKRFHQHPLLMAAAYNAGPRQVNHWLSENHSKAVDLWIETLPWHETRNYLKNIAAFYMVYQYRMNKSPILTPFQAFPG